MVEKKELVEMITKQKAEGFLEWVAIARDPRKGAVKVTPAEMVEVYCVVEEFKKGRKSYCDASLQYYTTAFDMIEKAYISKDLESFKDGLDLLLGLIGDD